MDSFIPHQKSVKAVMSIFLDDVKFIIIKIKAEIVIGTPLRIYSEYLAALQPVLVLGLQLIQGSSETLLLLRRNSGVRLVQKGASRLCDLE